MKDLKMLAGILAILVIVVPASWGVYTKTWEHKDLCDKYAELSKDFKIDQLERYEYSTKQKIWQTEERLEEKPKDKKAIQDKKELDLQLEKIQEKLHQLKKEGDK